MNSGEYNLHPDKKVLAVKNVRYIQTKRYLQLKTYDTKTKY